VRWTNKFRRQRDQQPANAMNLKTFIPILLFLLVASSGGSALCETSEKEARDDYTRLRDLVDGYNASNVRAINEYSSIHSKLINEHHASNVKLINKYNFITFILIITLHTILFIYVTFFLGYLQRIIVKQQRQIDEMKREWEDVKRER